MPAATTSVSRPQAASASELRFSISARCAGYSAERLSCGEAVMAAARWSGTAIMRRSDAQRKTPAAARRMAALYARCEALNEPPRLDGSPDFVGREAQRHARVGLPPKNRRQPNLRPAVFQPMIQRRGSRTADGDDAQPGPLVTIGRGQFGPHGVHAGFDFDLRAARIGQAELQ